MTYIEDTGRYGIEIRGHAEYAENGKDIVCAGVSMLACALCEYLIKHSHEYKDITVVSEDGNIVADVIPYDEYMDTNDAVFAMARIGFATLEKNYSENIKYSKKYK